MSLATVSKVPKLLFLVSPNAKTVINRIKAQIGKVFFILFVPRGIYTVILVAGQGF